MTAPPGFAAFQLEKVCNIIYNYKPPCKPCFCMPFLPTERKQHHRAGTAGEVNKVRQYPRYCNFRGRKPSPENGPGGKTANNADDGRVRHKICRPFSGTVRTGRTDPTAAKAENGRPPSAGRRSRRSFRARSGSGEKTCPRSSVPIQNRHTGRSKRPDA